MSEPSLIPPEYWEDDKLPECSLCDSIALYRDRNAVRPEHKYFYCFYHAKEAIRNGNLKSKDFVRLLNE